ncbi:hypothetical protein, partial [Mesorhizobium sp. M7A.F.Ca.US.002.01.1.1]|uniref:hypothetical protein n=1 Tax=Mesorhizobium sp. M7A.F.Ca.US.002.01.1.1 TaxID=2496700 RepID=UPI001FE003B0
MKELLAGFAEPLHQVDCREGKITHQPLDDPATDAIVVGKGNAADGSQPAIRNHAPVPGSRSHVLHVA